MSKNKGEYDELRLKLRLIELRDKDATIRVGGKDIKIESVGLENEFLHLPAGTHLSTMSDLEIEKLANSVGAGKAKGSYKADVNINGDGYSAKSHGFMPPAIVNHTPRWGWYRICNQLGIDIKPLDVMVDEYFRLREKGVLKEDAYNTDPNSPFAKNKEYLRPILNYFIFKGTGQSDSQYPAKFVLDFVDPLDEKTWRINDETNYIDTFWGDLKFSMRNKGFEAYPFSRNCDKWKTPLSKPWALTFDGSMKGSLHVRVV